MNEKINFICENCGKEFDYNIKKLTIDSKNDTLEVGSNPVCPHCKSVNKDLQINNKGNELEMSQLIMRMMSK